ncbi:MAG: 30S ribosomal protein S9 [Candidatus Nealsonbacteria bacterium]|nr:30S ribosomal protein S9 [Candidatus Nealsonbacteria bacterium]
MPVAKKTEKKEPVAPKAKPEKYLEAVGRRKTAIARVRLFPKGEPTFRINSKDLTAYFPSPDLQKIAKEGLALVECDKFGAEARVRGGGSHAQAEAIRHGVARSLVLFDPEFRKKLKKAGFLKRDPRVKERKKPGLKRARRAPQWAKR